MDNHAHQAQSDHKHETSHIHYGLPFFLILAFALIETWGGWWTQSLALLSDAWHMFTDVIALGLAWLAARLANQTQVKRHVSGMTYPELWASIANAGLMLVVVIWIVVEALQRLQNPPTVAGGAVFWIALVGLCVNLIVAKQLHHQHLAHGENLNNRAAYLHVLGDLLGSVVAIIAGVVIYFTGWFRIDPILSLLICVLLFVLTLKLAVDIWRTLSGKKAAHHNH